MGSATYQRRLFAGVYAVHGLLFALSLSWLVLVNTNFWYGFWHDVGGIGEGIDRYGPQNRYKPGFGETTRAQRGALFAQINAAVNNSGEGLEAITYQTPESRGPQPLLREPEVVHLQDVANLIDSLFVPRLYALLAFPPLVAVAQRKKWQPTLKSQLVSLGGILAVFGLSLAIAGPENLFNQLHIWVFPDEHQWFFYYQDSLMSTMMMAPTLFGYIAASWAAMAVVVFLVAHWMLRKYLRG